MSKSQIAAISAAILLIVLLLFAKTIPPRSVEKIADAGTEISMDQIAQWANDSADAGTKAKAHTLLVGLDHATTEQKQMLYDSLTRLWDQLQKPAVAAFYAEQRIKVAEPVQSQLLDIGNRYLGAARFSREALRPVLYHKAIEYFEKVSSTDPSNVQAKTSLGISYVEGTSDPMKGIGLLKDVVSKDSTNFDAQWNLGLFAVKSGQYDKAIIRFEKVLLIKPDNIETYLFLADAYERIGNKRKTIEMLEKYSSLTDDLTVKNQVKEYINKLKNS